MRILYISFLLLLLSIAHCQIILTEVMYDPEGPEKSDEFIEVYNMGVDTVDLSGWEVGDGLSFDDLAEVEANGLLLKPGQYGVIFDSNYFSDPSTSYNQIIPEEALILMIAGATLGSGGLSNSTAEQVFLVNASQDTVQKYNYSLGNISGFSDEKIVLSENNSPENWGDGLTLLGTPGANNSLTLKDFDLGITRFQLLSSTFIAGSDLPFEFWVKNSGVQSISEFQWQTFLDVNTNQLADPEEIIETLTENLVLQQNDSTKLSGEFMNIPFGETSFGILVQLENDENLANNISLQTVFVDNPSASDIIINEILFEPLTGYKEWVEIFNRGSEPVNLRNVFFADAKDTIQISESDRIVENGHYVVLGGDSLIAAQYGLTFDDLVINNKFTTLNNDFDDLRLMGPSFIAYDQVNYTSQWYGRDVEKGTSLEKLNPLFEGQISANWAASVAPSGNTPGQENSVYLNVPPTENNLDITPNPFSPDNDGFEDFAAIQFKLSLETAFANVRIFDIKGRLVRFLAKAEPIAHQGQFIWEGKDDTGRYARIGVYICLFQALNAERRIFHELKQTIVLIKK